VRGAALGEAAIAPVNSDALGMAGDFVDLDVAGKLLEQVALFLTRHIVPALDDEFQHGAGFDQ